ncbi:MAG TPA: thiol:disulfide interchange protein DsbA/DsbL [Rhodanobacteraceae bacterium]|nr:thiol:disulfide interchange protein DsbA/DsbL [Rhodanobacteraceae bacterium]
MSARWLLAAPALLFAGSALAADAAPKWVEGKNYTVIEPAQPTLTPGKVEVVEVFSYACPHCHDFVPFADKIRASLPDYASFQSVPAGFSFTAWRTFQRGYFAAQALGVADKAHDALFSAVFDKRSISGTDPTLDDLAKFYAAYGVKPDEFLATANSFGINAKIKRANERIKAWGVTGTPTLIVNGKYSLSVGSAGGFAQTVELVDWLVAREHAATP